MRTHLAGCWRPDEQLTGLLMTNPGSHVVHDRDAGECLGERRAGQQAAGSPDHCEGVPGAPRRAAVAPTIVHLAGFDSRRLHSEDTARAVSSCFCVTCV
ncbi:uncharacterized protein SOCE836_002310 [Sorangium cellulosum]|uniref:Uncharacterized protein n=1 Tax=Sorangium cellulosum TaxID=56 RepID=A0A4P2QFZ4_SORCE|nr:uncharacterized protein SOCE836_002310 [Sorangium cellulosum]WCQ87564.1 hypothetical protein NQZ70_00227 [Sorangium sp. Soce836]